VADHPPTAPSRAAFAVALVVAVSAPLLFYWVTWGDLDAFVRAIDHCAVPMCDFALHYDRMARAVFTHAGPVPGFLYPPGFAIALGALAPLSPAHAALAWWGVQIASIGALAGCGWVLLDGGRRPVFVAYVAVLLTAYPVLHNLKWGQVSAPITALVLLALVLVRRASARAQAGAGLLLAGAVAVKLYPVLFAPAVLRRERWRTVPWGTVTWFLVGAALFLLVIPALVLGAGETVDFYRAVFRRYSPAFLTDINAQYAPAVANRWLYAAGDRAMVQLVVPHALWPLAAGFARHAEAVLAAVAAAGAGIVVVNAWLVASLWRRGGPHAAVWTFVVIAATLPFVVPTSWPHYFSHLPFCQAWVLHRLLTDGGSRRVAVAKAVLLVLPSVALSSVVVFNAVGSWLVYNFFGGVFWANAFLLLAVYTALPRAAWAPPWRRVRDGGLPAAVRV